jgi:redox-sensing transcriptional repressor
MKKEINLYMIKRLSLYLRDLKRLQEQGVSVISSSRIPEILDVSPAQFRKDLSYFGGFGKRGVGYNINHLVSEIENILGANTVWNIALIGLGRLGSALLSYPGFCQFNLRIASVFESDKRKVGRVYNGVKVEDIKNIKNLVNARGIKIAMLCTPSEAVPDVMQLIKGSSIKAILNFTPVNLKKEKDIFVSNVNMSSELQTLIYFLKNHKL